MFKMKTKYLFITLLIGLTLILVGCSNQELEQQLQTQVDGLNQQNQGLQSEVNNLQDENEKLGSQIENLNIEITELNDKNQENIQECISYLNDNNYDFPKGEIAVGFVSIVDTEQIIQDIGLEKMAGNLKWAILKVPIGSEVEWVCKLKENPYLEYSKLNVIPTG